MHYTAVGLTLEQDNPYTIRRKLFETKSKVESEYRDVHHVIESIAEACKIIYGKVGVASLTNLYGHANEGSNNASGDVQKKIDVLSNKILINTLRFCDSVGIITSEEEEDVVWCNEEGEYIVAIDPLDGSGNIDCNASIGTIFGIWKKKSKGKGSIEEDVLRSGRELVAAGYCLYASSSIFVMAFGGEVNGFTYDPALGSYILSHPNLKIPVDGDIYSVNEGNSRHWHESTKQWVKDKKLRMGKGSATLRYIGTMVSDVHRTLLYGGVFLYPVDHRYPNGRLRMLFECLPLGWLITVAGGAAISDTEDLLDQVPTDLHSRTGIALGSKNVVAEILEFNKKFPISESINPEKPQ